MTALGEPEKRIVAFHSMIVREGRMRALGVSVQPVSCAGSPPSRSVKSGIHQEDENVGELACAKPLGRRPRVADKRSWSRAPNVVSECRRGAGSRVHVEQANGSSSRLNSRHVHRGEKANRDAVLGPCNTLQPACRESALHARLLDSRMFRMPAVWVTCRRFVPAVV